MAPFRALSHKTSLDVSSVVKNMKESSMQFRNPIYLLSGFKSKLSESSVDSSLQKEPPAALKKFKPIKDKHLSNENMDVALRELR